MSSRESLERAKELVEELTKIAIAELDCGPCSSDADDKSVTFNIADMVKLSREALDSVRLEEAEWWANATNCVQGEAREMNERLNILRQSVVKGAG